MNLSKSLVIVVILAIGGLGYFLYSQNKSGAFLTSSTPTPTSKAAISPTPFPDTKSAIAAFLAKKYNRPVSEVGVTVDKEVPGFASGSVLFGQGGPGEGGMWLALLGNGWEVVWDGNGNVDCNKMRQQYGFPDTILKPNFCN